MAFQDGWGILATALTTKPHKHRDLQKRELAYGAPYLLESTEAVATADNVSRILEGVALAQTRGDPYCSDTYPGNLIAFNLGNGVEIIKGSSANFVSGNRILSNSQNGVEINSCAFNNSVTANAIEKNCGYGVIYPKGSSTQLISNCIEGNGKGSVKQGKSSKNCGTP